MAAAAALSFSARPWAEMAGARTVERAKEKATIREERDMVCSWMWEEHAGNPAPTFIRTKAKRAARDRHPTGGRS
jgi:hypothetical protein